MTSSNKIFLTIIYKSVAIASSSLVKIRRDDHETMGQVFEYTRHGPRTTPATSYVCGVIPSKDEK